MRLSFHTNAILQLFYIYLCQCMSFFFLLGQIISRSFVVNLQCKSNKPLIRSKRALTLTHTKALHPKHLGATQKRVTNSDLKEQVEAHKGSGQFAPSVLPHPS